MYVVDVSPAPETTVVKSSRGLSVKVEAAPLLAGAPWMVSFAPGVVVVAVTEIGYRLLSDVTS